MLFLYNILLILGGILTAPFWILLILLTPKYRKNFIQRFGYYPTRTVEKLKNQRPVWIHAVSVGETLTAILLVKAFKKKYPDIPILISNVTVTGNHIAHQYAKLFDGIIYFPLDFPWIVSRSLRLFNPRMILIMETELWPNFIHQAHCQKTPMILVNGRLSDKSIQHYLKLKPLFRQLVNQMDGLLMQSKEDGMRMESLGGHSEILLVTGNIKFDLPSPVFTPQQLESLQNQFGIKGDNDLVWVVGSTHPGEETILLTAFTSLRQQFPELKLILVPRHPERALEIEALIKEYNYTYLKRSQMDQSGKLLESSPDIFLIDTVGELLKLYCLAKVTFVGGSLVPTGGHNVLEPAVCHKPVIFGPHMHNFRDSAELLIHSGGGIMVNNADEIQAVMEQLLLNPEEAIRLGKVAAAAVQSNTGATQKTLEYMLPYLQ